MIFVSPISFWQQLLLQAYKQYSEIQTRKKMNITVEQCIYDLGLASRDNLPTAAELHQTLATRPCRHLMEA
jgi:hypothetical protein